MRINNIQNKQPQTVVANKIIILVIILAAVGLIVLGYLIFSSKRMFLNNENESSVKNESQKNDSDASANDTQEEPLTQEEIDSILNQPATEDLSEADVEQVEPLTQEEIDKLLNQSPLTGDSVEGLSAEPLSVPDENQSAEPAPLDQAEIDKMLSSPGE